MVRIANGLRKAGVAISVTSMTDFIVFAVGGTTILPSLKSYSFYAAMGILFTFINQVTFFVACLTLDTKRIDAKRDGMFFCISYGQTWKPNALSQRNFLQDLFRALGNQLKKKQIRVGILLMAAALTAIGTYGVLLVRIEFDFLKFLPEESQLFRWYEENSKFFPEEGFRGNIYFSEVDVQR